MASLVGAEEIGEEAALLHLADHPPAAIVQVQHVLGAVLALLLPAWGLLPGCRSFGHKRVCALATNEDVWCDHLQLRRQLLRQQRPERPRPLLRAGLLGRQRQEIQGPGLTLLTGENPSLVLLRLLIMVPLGLRGTLLRLHAPQPSAQLCLHLLHLRDQPLLDSLQLDGELILCLLVRFHTAAERPVVLLEFLQPRCLLQDLLLYRPILLLRLQTVLRLLLLRGPPAASACLQHLGDCVFVVVKLLLNELVHLLHMLVHSFLSELHLLRLLVHSLLQVLPMPCQLLLYEVRYKGFQPFPGVLLRLQAALELRRELLLRPQAAIELRRKLLL
mmetsp:Transcript_3754/g.10362  ORF Transcript_3754/g.10362 Transcript_3754/m.10362 type:complete len:331 (+) Transcript_3754:496-1488(+)